MLVLIGSGETSPTMVTVHRDLLSRLGRHRPQALLLATPYAFQENAASVSARARRYFADSVGLEVRIAPGTSHDAGPEVAPPMVGETAYGAGSSGRGLGHDGEQGLETDSEQSRETDDQEWEAADIRSADWVFAGPGSPSYALAHWRTGPVGAALRERVLAGDGLTVLASAAAATAGQFTLPVYEIYKAGGAPRWLGGLDLLGALGLRVAVIPHYDNAEGGRYDTRYCYLGERRLAVMERELPVDAAVLGVDEHTAMLIDLRTNGIEIRGRGGVTVRRADGSTILAAGTSMSVADLRGLVLGMKPTARDGRALSARDGADGEDGVYGETAGGSGSGTGHAAGTPSVPVTVPAVPLPEVPLPEVMAEAERGFGVAAGGRDAAAMVAAILALENTIKQWEADTDEDQGTEQARALLRGLIGRLGRTAQHGLADPRDRLRPAVEPLIALRNALRGEGNFAAADAIRQALAAAGLDLSDTPDDTRWETAETVRPGGDPPRPLHIHHVAARLGRAVLARTSLSTPSLAAHEPDAPGTRGADSVPGMNSGLSPDDPTLVAAFRSALLHQGAVALIAVVFLWLIWATARTWRLATSSATLNAGSTGAAGEAEVAADAGKRDGGKGDAGKRDGGKGERSGLREARGRWLLRIGFGVLWILDGILQAQPKMAAGLPSLVIEPTAASSPAWVQHLVNWGGTIWSYHPIQAGAATVWIQVGIGAWLIVAGRGRWSRLAGAASVGWGLIVWVFGESFGGIFAPSLSWLTGAPGGVLFYVAAGALIALPEGTWRNPRLGRLVLAGFGIFFIGMAVLQAWPGRGFWQGTVHGRPGSLTGMVQSMVSTPQPHFLSALLSAFSSFVAGHGFAVNLVVVIVLAVLGVIFLTAWVRLVRYAVWFGIATCLADWLLVQDLGFLGGVGTDPNSMIPMALLFSVGYLALTPLPREAVGGTATVVADGVAPGGTAPGGTAPGGTAAGDGRGRRVRALRPRALGGVVASASARSVAAVAAVAVIVLGAAPMASATANHSADPILALAIEGGSTSLDLPAPGFSLTDQDGQAVSLASLRGKVVLMTFLDPVCTSDCPIIAQEFKQTSELLGAKDKDVELVAVVANPTYRSTAFTQAFDRQEGLAGVPNWLYLTGSVSQLGAVWQQYGVSVTNLPAGAMAAHNDLAVVIDGSGHIREEVGADPGPATTSTQSSFSVLLTGYARQALDRS
jgi:cytochrome oxidase Cu insertion factor (SCO1/SenC/PrrC family)